jgi:hypothetical protein
LLTRLLFAYLLHYNLLSVVKLRVAKYLVALHDLDVAYQAAFAVGASRALRRWCLADLVHRAVWIEDKFRSNEAHAIAFLAQLRTIPL